MGPESNRDFKESTDKTESAGHQKRFRKTLERLRNHEEIDRNRTQTDSFGPGELEQAADSVIFADSKSISQFLSLLTQHSEVLAESAFEKPLEKLFRQIVQRIDQSRTDFGESWLIDEQLDSDIDQIYRRIPDTWSARNHLLALLATLQSSRSLQLFASLIVDDPPIEPRGAVLAFSPLIRNKTSLSVEDLFPKLLEALRFRHMAAIILDLTNFSVRQGWTKDHPASARGPHLGKLLSQVVQQLEMIEEGNVDGKSPHEISENVNESVALCVALIDALALIRNEEAMGPVRQAMELKHRRVKTEAAAALVRLGDTLENDGREQLVKLAAEPICRLRVIEYASELGLLDQIESQYQTDAARAESKLALWLASPTQMGVAPTSMQLGFQERMHWPSFEEPVTVYLFRFEYRFAGQAYSNVGIVGPMTHAFGFPLEHLPLNLILAAFAGWQTEHEEIYTIDWSRAESALAGLSSSLSRRLRSEYPNAQEKFVGYFFETPVLLAESASFDETDGGHVVAVDRDRVFAFPRGTGNATLTAEVGFNIYCGLHILNTFNEPELLEHIGQLDNPFEDPG